MELYLLRHADAEEFAPAHGGDSERALTTKGKHQARGVADGLRSLEISFDVIFFSPFVRARQTAEIVAELLKLHDKVEMTQELVPGGDGKALISEIKIRRADSVLLVGHEPCLSRLISMLLSGRPDLSIKMKKAAVCKLEIEAPRFGEIGRAHV